MKPFPSATACQPPTEGLRFGTWISVFTFACPHASRSQPDFAKLLATNKSDLMDKFISKAGKPFPAFLVMDNKGKITFDFPEREE